MTINNEKLRELCIEGKMTNRQLAKEFDVDVTDIYAWRSRHGLTINKCTAIREGKIRPGKRASEEIRAEIKKVEKAKADAYKKFCRAEDRLEELYGELEVTEK